MNTTEQPDDDRSALTLRIPVDLLAEVDKFAESERKPDFAPSRNAILLTLIRRGLADATRPRGKR